MEVKKISGHMMVSRDQGIDWGIVEPTEAEKAQRAERDAKYQADRKAATEAWPVFVAALTEVTDPIARLVLDLHGSRDGYCRGCEFGGGGDAESPAWPCTTTTAVAAAVGVHVPADLWFAEQAKL